MDIIINGKPLSSLRVVDLKEELEKRRMSKSGTKKDLMDRLRQVSKIMSNVFIFQSIQSAIVAIKYDLL